MENRPPPKLRRSPYNYEFIEEYIMTHGRNTASWEALGKKYKRDRRNVERWFKRAEDRPGSQTIRYDPRDKIPVKKYKHIEINRRDQEAYVEAVIQWLYAFCGMFFKWTPAPGYIRRLVHAFIYKPNTLVLLPRKHGKSITLMCLVAWWMIEQKKSMLVITSDYHAQKRYFFALRHILKSKIVREHYGDLLYSDNQKDWSFMFVEEFQGGMGRFDPMFRCATYKGGYVGSHPDGTLMDDIQQTVPVSKSTQERLTDDYDDNIQDISEWKFMSGTRKGLNDIYSAMFKRGFIPLHEKAVEFTKGTFPTQRDFHFKRTIYGEEIIDTPVALKLKYLKSVRYEILGCPDFSFTKLMIRYWQNPNSFYSQMQNLPRHKTGRQFKEIWWKEIEPHGRGETALDRYIYADFASGESEKSSDSCFVVCVPHNYKLYIIDIIIGKFSLDQFEEKAVELDKLYNPLEFLFENDFSQVTTRYAPESPLLTISGFGVFFSKGKGNKIARINALSNPFRMDKFRIYSTCEGIREAREQYLSWNETKEGYDFLDTLSSAHSGLNKYISTSKTEHIGVQRH